jgi:Raf kinase inhibitor-like YbhB/YbcL family protein
MFRPALAVVSLIALTACLVACGGANDKGASPTGPATPAGTPRDGATEASTFAPATTANGTPVPPGSFRLTSSAFKDNEAIPAVYTCDGVDAIPPLTISGAPDNVVTLALTVTDVDGPGGDFVHWVVWDIPPTSTDTPGGTVPAGGQEALTSQDTIGYVGPCPSSGEHHYVFELYALDTDITIVTLENGKAELLQAMQGHILDQTKLTGTYTRTR